MFRIQGSPDVPNSPDFRFSDAESEYDHCRENGIKHKEVEPKLLQAYPQDDYSSYSPPLWKTCPSKADVLPLLPLRHPCSDLSPRSRTRTIAKSREEMMKMIKDLPESSYELSLKDIVDLHISPETKAEPPIEEEPGFFLNPQQIKPTKKMSKITRSDSTDKKAILIRTFFPSFSMSKRKQARDNISRIIPRSSSIIGSKSSKGKKQRTDNPVKETAGLANKSIIQPRDEDEKDEVGCWSSLTGRKTKAWRTNGCLF